MKRMSTKVLSIILAVILLLSSAVTGFAANDFPLIDLVFTSAETLYEETEGWSSNKLVGTVTVDIKGPAKDLVMNSFGGCDNLKSVYINIEDPESNFRIDSLSGCDNLTSVTIKSNGNVSLDWCCFNNNSALENLVFDIKGTLRVQKEAFENCPNLTEIDFSNIGNLVLYKTGCFSYSSLKEVNLLPNTTFEPYIDEIIDGDYYDYVYQCNYFFSNNDNLEEFTADCEEIPVGSFAHCNNLKKAFLTQRVKKIEYLAFGMSFDYENYKVVPLEGFVTYGYTNSAAEEYCDKYGIKFIPVDGAEFNTITSSQSTAGTVGATTSVTLSVAGFPETLKLENPLGSELTFTREDAEIVTSETGELWTVDLIPMSEETNFTVTADYGLADLCATDEITVFAEKAEVPPSVISAETITPAVIGELAQVSVKVSGSPLAVRFIDSVITTINREDATVTDNGDGTETWVVSLPVNYEEQRLIVFAKGESGWVSTGIEFVLKAKVVDSVSEISDFAFEESLDGVIYNGMNTITLTTADGVSKVQLMKDGNTWTFTEDNSEVIEVDGKKYWTLKMNFWTLGEQTYDIRVRTPKTTFETVYALNVTVYSR